MRKRPNREQQRRARWLSKPGLAGVCFAALVSLPILRAVTGVSDLVYAIPIGVLIPLLSLGRPLRVGSAWVGIHLLAGLMFCAWMLFSGLWSMSSTRIATDIVLVLYLMAVLVLGALGGEPAVTRWTLKWIVFASLATAMVVLFAYVDSGSIRGYGTLVNDFYLVASSTLGAGAVGLTAHVVSAERFRPLHLVVLLIIFAGLSLSLGRMALLATVGLTLFIGVYSVRARTRSAPGLRGIVKGASVGVIITMFAGGVFWGAMQVERTAKRFERLFGGIDQELVSGGRGRLWSQAWNKIGDAPVFGHGLGSSGILSSGAEDYYPHNLFLQIWLDGGLVGVILLLVTIGIPLGLFWQRRNDSGHQALPYLAMFLFYLLTYQTSLNAYTARSVMLMGILLTSTLSQRTEIRD